MDVELEILHFLSKPEELKELLDLGVRSDHFKSSANRAIWDFGIEYFTQAGFKSGVPVTLLQDEFPEVFQQGKWVEETEFQPKPLGERIKERFRRNEAQDLLRDLATKVMEDPTQTVIEGISGFSRIQFQSSNQRRQEVHSQGYDQRVEDYYDRVEEKQRLAAEGLTVPNHPLWFPEVTEFTYGLAQGEVGVLVAMPNTGKSWSMCRAAVECVRSGSKVYLANLENSHELTMMRLDCIFSGIPYTAYERGNLTPAQVAQLEAGKEEFREMEDLLIVDSPNTASERTAYELYTRASFIGAEVMLGDQLSWVTATQNYTDSNAGTLRMTEVVTDITSLSRELGIASLWAAQFNRKAAASSGRGGLHNIALSTTIEQIVDWAFALSTSDEMKENEAVLLEILKARRAGLKGWLCNWALQDETNLSVRREYTD